MPEKEPKESDFIATARKRFEAADSDEKEIRAEAKIDFNFVAGEQWDPKLKADREAKGRPAITFPRCHTFVQQVSNEARQNKPQIKFAPTDDKADDDTAEIYEGLARHIQYSSDAQIAYENSVENSAGGSFGYYRFLTKETDNGDQDLEIMPVLDPFAIYGILVPACFGREPRFGFVVEDLPEEEFKDIYPKSPITTGGIGGSDSSWMSSNGWTGTDTVRIAEYWYCVGQGKETKVKFCKMSGMEVLEMTSGEKHTEWLGYCIPIIPVLGKQMIVGGKPKLFSVVRYQRGAQTMLNYAKSRIAETLSIAPVSPWIVARGQIQKGDTNWTDTTKMPPYLEYDSVDVNGKPAPPPQRQVYEPPIMSLSAFVQQEIDDMKATTGIFDASLGQKSNETSSVAITNRQQQSSMTTMHFMDNLERAFKKGGKIMEDIFPKIYDTERIIRILGADEAAKVVKINAPYSQPGSDKQKHYKMGGDEAGKYSAIVTMGRAFSTKKMESFDMFQGIVQGNPQLLTMIGDIMFRNSDIAGADQLAERFKKMLPPNLQDNEADDPENQLQQVQAQNAQLQQAHQALNAYAQQLEKEKEGKVVEQQGKVQMVQIQEQSKQAIAMMQEETKRLVAEITTKAQDARERAKLDADMDKTQHVSAHEAGMQAVEHRHTQQLAAQQAAVVQQTQAADQQHDSESQAADQSHEATMADVGHAQTLEQQQAAAELQPAGGNDGQ